MNRSVIVVADATAVEETAARRFLAAVGEGVAARGRAHIALSGGATPEGLYRRLAEPEQRERVAWSNVDFWWSDERAVPPDSPESNYRLARDLLLSHLELDPSQVHRMAAESAGNDSTALEKGARRYEEEILAAVPGEAGRPRFDLVLLGIGADGHTASLFPRSPALGETGRNVIPVQPERGIPRLSLTLPLINAARQIHLLAHGSAKARAVARAIDGEPGPDSPASLVAPVDGTLYWIIDAAANLLRRGGGVGEGEGAG